MTDGIKYLCYSPEYTTKGEFHWQWYAYFTTQKSISATVKYLRKHWSAKATTEVCVGSPKENRTYCGGDKYEKKLDDGGTKIKEKNPDFVEFGTLPNPGQRGDLDSLKDAILAGTTTVDEICVEQPMLVHQYGRTLDRCEDIAMQSVKRTEMTEGFWIYGPTGTGKSHQANEMCKDVTSYWWPNDNGWWDGYRQQHTVILNDFRGGLKFNELLQLIDKWPHAVKRRGRAPLPFTSSRVIITSSIPPWECYTTIGNDRIAQLMDRVTVVALEGDSRRKLKFADAATSPTLPNSSLKLLRGGQGNTGLTNELKRKGKPLKLDV